VDYQPSTVAAAVTLHVIREMDFGGEDFDFCKNKLCRLLQFINKEKFEACYQLILQASICTANNHAPNQVGINEH